MIFDDVKAQPSAVRVLRAALDRDRVASAYLFEGPSGIGKERTAIAFASAALCTKKPNIGCGMCETCRRVEGGKHPDVRLITPREEGDRNLQVEFVRSEVLPFSQFAPFEGPRAFLIFREADVSLPAHHAEAANALLKTIEEPRARVHFVFLAERAERLLPTIRSRAQRVRFQRLPELTLSQILESRGVHKDKHARAIALSAGSADRALAFAGEGSEALAALVRRTDAAIESKKPSRVIASAEELAKHDDLHLVLDVLSLHYRDVAWTSLHSRPPETSLLPGDELRERAKTLSAEGAASRAIALVSAQQKLERAVNAELFLDALLPELSRMR